MTRLERQVRECIEANRSGFSIHAEAQCEQRGITPWQVAASAHEARLVRLVPHGRPQARVVLRHSLPTGDVEPVWAWLPRHDAVLLITVYWA
jgi:pentose-5-phosphate-3-epimerase